MSGRIFQAALREMKINKFKALRAIPAPEAYSRLLIEVSQKMTIIAFLVPETSVLL